MCIRDRVGRARQLIALYQGRVKPILVGGSYLDLMQSWHCLLYTSRCV